MTNLERYDKLFMDAFKVTKDELPTLKYQGHPAWDSVGHMDLMSTMEEVWKISISTVDVLDFSTYEHGKKILARYGVDMEAEV